MGLDSYLELYTTLYGWMCYRVLWDVLVGTGIAYLPFLGVLIDHWKSAFTIDDASAAANLSLRNLELDVFIAMCVIVLAVQPGSITPLKATELSYTPPPTLTTPTPTSVTVADSTSTYGEDGFTNATASVETPAWWYAVISVSAGINHAVIEALPRASELRQVVNQARLATIEPPALKGTVSQFYHECYLPARSKFLLEQPSSTSIDAIYTANGHGDTDWIGSHVSRDTAGYYDSFRVSQPQDGWPYDPRRDTEYTVAPTNGRPYCKDWWEHSTRGVRQQIVDSVELNAAEFVRLSVATGFTVSTEPYLDQIAKTALLNAPEDWSNNTLIHNNVDNRGVLGTLERAAKGTASTVGLGVVSGFILLMVNVLTQALPIFQAVILLGIYALLPLYLVFSRYSYRAMIDGAIAIFTVKFWTVLWFIVLWIDQNLITSMYPDTNVLVEAMLFNSEHLGKRIVLNLTTSLLYIGLPILFSMMMAWAGVRLGSSLDSTLTPYGQISTGAGRGGVQATSSLIRGRG